MTDIDVWYIFLQTRRFLLRRTVIDGLESYTCKLLCCFCQLFGQQRIHWWASDVMLNFSKSVQMKKQTHLLIGWLEGKSILANFSFFGELFISCFHIRHYVWVKCKLTQFASSEMPERTGSSSSFPLPAETREIAKHIQIHYFEEHILLHFTLSLNHQAIYVWTTGGGNVTQ